MQSHLLSEDHSLTDQIMYEINKMDMEEQKKLLMQLRKQTILEKVKNLDATTGTVKSNAMNDEEADAYISEQRKLRYEQQTKA